MDDLLLDANAMKVEFVLHTFELGNLSLIKISKNVSDKENSNHILGRFLNKAINLNLLFAWVIS